MEKLFVNIQKYIPRKDRNPKEDFFSEILAFILGEDKILLSKFVKLCGVNTGGIKNYEIRTQVKHEKYGRPDIEIIINDSIFIIIENKIDSTQRYNQLKDYLKLAQEENYKQSRVVYLTKYHEDIDKKIRKKINHIYWRDIYKIFKEYKTNKKIDFLIQQFIDLMGDENMEPFKKIDELMLKNYIDVYDNVNKLFAEVTEEFKKDKHVKKGRFSVSWDFIAQYFHFKNVKFSIDFDGEEFFLHVYGHKEKKKIVTKKQEEKFKRYGFKVNGTTFIMGFKVEKNKKFLNADAKKQIEMLRKFYIDNFNTMKKILK